MKVVTDPATLLLNRLLRLLRWRVWVQERQVEIPQLGPLLKEISGQNPDVRIFVRGDQAIHYGRVLEVMGAIQAAGFTKVALVARSPGQDPVPAAK